MIHTYAPFYSLPSHDDLQPSSAVYYLYCIGCIEPILPRYLCLCTVSVYDAYYTESSLHPSSLISKAVLAFSIVYLITWALSLDPL